MVKDDGMPAVKMEGRGEVDEDGPKEERGLTLRLKGEDGSGNGAKKDDDGTTSRDMPLASHSNRMCGLEDHRSYSKITSARPPCVSDTGLATKDTPSTLLAAEAFSTMIRLMYRRTLPSVVTVKVRVSGVGLRMKPAHWTLVASLKIVTIGA